MDVVASYSIQNYRVRGNSRPKNTGNYADGPPNSRCLLMTRSGLRSGSGGVGSGDNEPLFGEPAVDGQGPSGFPKS